MSFRRVLAGFCFIWLVASSFLAQAEAIRPRLSKACFDSLRNELLHSLPDTNWVRLLLVLSQDFIYPYDDLPAATDLRAGLAYSEQPATHSTQPHFAAGRIVQLVRARPIAPVPGSGHPRARVYSARSNRKPA